MRNDIIGFIAYPQVAVPFNPFLMKSKTIEEYPEQYSSRHFTVRDEINIINMLISYEK